MSRVRRQLVDITALGAGGRALWDEILKENPDLLAQQKVQLLEACRMKDRLDKLDEILRGDVATWATIKLDRRGEVEIELVIDGAASLANATADKMKQLLAAARLVDASGKLPNRPRTPSGVYTKSAGKVSSLDKAREARS